jgi:anaerobic dimethyl sulfoxide reductase subunit C (anchor subunit)
MAGGRCVMEVQFELIVFTLFICLGAGIFAVQGFLSYSGKGKSIQKPALLCSFGAIVVGGIGSFLHLQHWNRIFNGFGHLASGITQELICIVLFVVSLAVYFVMLRRSADGKFPQWCSILAMLVSLVLVVVAAMSYNMPARPVWDTPILWFYYLANALSLGGLAVLILAGIKADDSVGPASLACLIGVVAQAIATAVYALYFNLVADSFTAVGSYFDPNNPTKPLVDFSTEVSAVFTGEHAILFWAGVVLAGLLVPLVVVLATRKRDAKQVAVFAGLCLVCALVGGFCFRIVFYVLGSSIFMFY